MAAADKIADRKVAAAGRPVDHSPVVDQAPADQERTGHSLERIVRCLATAARTPLLARLARREAEVPMQTKPMQTEKKCKCAMPACAFGVSRSLSVARRRAPGLTLRSKRPEIVLTARPDEELLLHCKPEVPALVLQECDWVCCSPTRIRALPAGSLDIAQTPSCRFLVRVQSESSFLERYGATSSIL